MGLFELNASFRGGKTVDGMEVGPEVNEKESARWLRGLDRAQELAAACPGTRVVNICDREGDFWELLCKAASDGARLLVRASRSAQRQVILEGGRKADLWEHLAGQPRLATQTLELAACGGKRSRKKRTVHIDIRATEVRLAPPQTAAGQPPVRMLAVSATETPNRKNGLHWLLLTTEGLAAASAESGPEAEAAEAGNLVETAKTAIRWYELRWTIELFFKALKSGTRIEDRRLDHADDLRKCLVFDAITACHVFDLERMARDKPDTPAGEVVTQEEIDVLYALRKAQGGARARAPPSHRPDIRTFVIDLAGIVGFHPRRQQPLPGTQKVWQAYVRLKWATLGHLAMKGTNLI